MDLSDLSALLGEDAGGAAQRDIWVVAPSLSDGAALIAEARRLADGLGCYVQAVVVAEADAPAAITLGADYAHVTPEVLPYLAGQQPEFVLLPSALNALAARLAQRFGAGLITDTATIEINGDTRALRGAHLVYGGDYALALEVSTPVKMATVDVRGWPAPYPDEDRSGEVVISDLPAAAKVSEPTEGLTYTPPKWRPLQKTSMIVAVGRGVGGEAGVALAQRLAAKLGAEFAGDRSARDSGWIDEAHEVGVTGQEVAPQVYVALGILGDTIHNAAIARAKKVIAVHRNREAPIFKVADVAIVGEPVAIMERLLEIL